MAKKLIKNIHGKLLGVFLHDIYKAALAGLKTEEELHPVPLSEYSQSSLQALKSVYKVRVLSIKLSDGSIISSSNHVEFANKLLTAVLEGKTVEGDEKYLQMKFVKSFPYEFTSNNHQFFIEVEVVNAKPLIEAPEKTVEKTSEEDVPKPKKSKKAAVEASDEE